MQEESEGEGSGLCQVESGEQGVAQRWAGILWSGRVVSPVWSGEGNAKSERVPGNSALEEKHRKSKVGAEKQSLS